MFFYWPKRNYLTWSQDYATVTYDPFYYSGGIKYSKEGPSSCIWIVPGTHEED